MSGADRFPPPPSPPPPPPPAPLPGPDGPVPQDAWLRLDRRMLFVQPVEEFVKFLPALVGLAIAGGASGFGPWALFGVVVPIALGVARYLTTSYRIAGGRVELRRGILQRRTTTARLERVRTVDLSATLWHRVLGLATLTIGTGSVSADEDERLRLDGLPRDRASRLRSDLLDRVAGATPATGAPGMTGTTGTADRPTPLRTDAPPVPGPPGTPGTPAGPGSPRTLAPPEEIVRFRADWIRYAPFTGTGLIAAAAVLGVLAQGTQSVDLGMRIDEGDLPAFTWALVATLAVGVVVAAVALSLGGYLATNWDFRLSRDRGSWHVRRGLFTTRETSLDEARVAGVSIGEPAALRWVNGGHLRAIVTGLEDASGASAGLVPTAPRADVDRAAVAVLGSRAAVDGPLLPHGRQAARRRLNRALLAVVPVVVALGAAVAVGAPAWLLAAVPVLLFLAVVVARDRARGLGHAWVDGFVVMRSGSLARRRTALGAEHVIGWNLRDSYFQRRAGLVSLAATTAGGTGRTEVYDVPTADAYDLAEQATPGLLAQFRR